MSADTITIYYWPDGTWCYRWELEQMTHMSDDFATTEVDPLCTADSIETLVDLLNEGNFHG